MALKGDLRDLRGWGLELASEFPLEGARVEFDDAAFDDLFDDLCESDDDLFGAA